MGTRYYNLGYVLDDRSFETNLAGVNSSSQSSTPIQVSKVLTTASPNGTVD